MNVADHLRANLDTLAPHGLTVRRRPDVATADLTPSGNGPATVSGRVEAGEPVVTVYLPDYDEAPAELTVASGSGIRTAELVECAHRAVAAMLDTVHRNTLAHVHSANAALLSSMDEKNILDRVVRIAIDVIADSDAGVFRLFDVSAARLIVTSQIGFEEEFYRYTYQKNESISGAVYSSRRPVLFRSSAEILAAHRNLTQRNRRFLQRTRIANSLICVPVVDGDECIGTLTILKFRDDVPFCAYDLSVLEVFATHVVMALKHARDHAKAIDNIRLLRQLQAEIEAKNIELASALNIYERIMGAYTGGGSFAEKIERAAKGVGLDLSYDDLLGNRFATSDAIRAHLSDAEGAPVDAPPRAARGFVRRDVQLSGVTIGRLVVADAGNSLLTAVKTDVLISFIVLELANHATREDLVNRRVAGIFRAYLDSGRIDAADRTLIDFAPSKLFRIVLMRPVGGPPPARADLAFQSSLRALRDRIAPKNCMLFYTDTTLVAFMSAATSGLIDKLSQALVHEARGAATGCAMSVVYADPHTHAEHYRRATACLEVVVARNRPDVLVADRLGFEQLLHGQGRRPVLDFVAEVLGPIETYRGGGSALYETLRTFIATGKSATETAKALGIHPNTVYLRLERVHQLTGYDATDPEGFLQLSIASHLRDRYAV
jgi:hypothetical protein